MSLYTERSVSQCLETAFDFMRSCRNVWFKMVLWLFLPPCLVATFVIKGGVSNMNGSFAAFDCWSYLVQKNVILAPFIGMWLALVLVHALLDAYGQQGAAVDGFSMRQMLPYLRRQVLRSGWLSFLFPISFLASNGWEILVFVAWLLFSLLPSVYLLERLNFWRSVFKSVRLSVRSILSLVAVVFFALLFGFLMLTALYMPIELMAMAKIVFPVGYVLGSVATTLFSGLFFTLFLVGYEVVLSMLLLVLACHYGSVSERVDDASLESDIENFENL